MIPIEQLRTLRLPTRDLDAGVAFARDVVGLQLVGRDATQAAFRSDDRHHTLVYDATPDARATIALELRDPETLVRAADALTAHGYTVRHGTAPETERRRVKAFIAFTDEGGLGWELVVRPLHSGWRCFPPRDAGITGLAGVAVRTPDVARAEHLWTTVFSGRVSDWVGEAPYIRFDSAHHRLAFHPAAKGGVLAVEFAVESVDQLMQSAYHLEKAQVRVLHGPGRRPTSGQMFLTFAGPEGVAYSYVAEGRTIGDEAAHRPRQFARDAASFCAWGSRSALPEFEGEARARGGLAGGAAQSKDYS